MVLCSGRFNIFSNMFLNAFAILSFSVTVVPSYFLTIVVFCLLPVLTFFTFSKKALMLFLLLFSIFVILCFFHSLLAIVIVLFFLSNYVFLLAKVLLFSLFGFCITFRHTLSLTSKAFLQLSLNHILLFSLCVFPSILSTVSLITYSIFSQVIFLSASWFVSYIPSSRLSWYSLISFQYISVYYFLSYITSLFFTDILKSIITLSDHNCTVSCLTLSAYLQVRSIFGSLYYYITIILLFMTIFLFDVKVTSILPFSFIFLCRLSSLIFGI